MKPGDPIFGEESLSTVAALFADRATAQAAADRVRAALGPDAALAIHVVAPGDRQIPRKLEPEEKGVMFTAIKAHITLGLVGLVVGLLLSWVLYSSGIAAIRSNPLVATVVITGFATAFGLFAGGLVTLRPDHDPLNLRVMEEVGKGRHAVLVHPIRHGDAARAAELLEAASGEVIRTL